MSQTEDLVDFLDRTGNLLIHLLNQCNLRCKHCYLSAHKNGNQILPLDLVMRTISEADELGIKSVQFSGGEPFLYPDITEVIKSTAGKNFAVSISTNGTLINDAMAKLLAEINARVVTSIDGPAEYHDLFRGQIGSFAKTKDGIDRLVKLDIPVKIVTTVCEDSLKFVDWCAEWANGMQAEVLQFQPLESIGRGKGLKTKRLQQEQLHDLFIHLNDLAAYYAPRGLRIKMTYRSRKFMLAHPCSAFICNGKGCHRGIEQELKKIIIREDGSILPELVDIDRRFAIGNLFDDTLENCLRNYLKEGYSRFDRLCREVYRDTILTNLSPLIPWNEILSERSRTFG